MSAKKNYAIFGLFATSNGSHSERKEPPDGTFELRSIYNRHVRKGDKKMQLINAMNDAANIDY